MTKDQFAEMLNGREYGREITRDEARLANENGLVVVYGALDDLMEFEGAIYDEVDCWGGGFAYFDETGLWVNECDDDCPYAEKEQEKCKTIEAVYCSGSGPVWTYVTDIPHATFDIYYEGGVYCQGIVFDMDALKHRR